MSLFLLDLGYALVPVGGGMFLFILLIFSVVRAELGPVDAYVEKFSL